MLVLTMQFSRDKRGRSASRTTAPHASRESSEDRRCGRVGNRIDARGAPHAVDGSSRPTVGVRSRLITATPSKRKSDARLAGSGGADAAATRR